MYLSSPAISFIVAFGQRARGAQRVPSRPLHWLLLFPNHPVALGPRLEETVLRVSSSPRPNLSSPSLLCLCPPRAARPSAPLARPVALHGASAEGPHGTARTRPRHPHRHAPRIARGLH
eukprot:9322199-Pyramimonas_sp.AAC.1